MSNTSHNSTSKEFIVFTACAMILTALGIDIMLPAFGDVRRHFAIVGDTTQTAKLVSYFFMGQITQIVFGYMSDKMGRLPILRLGVILYMLSGFATVFAPSLAWMFVFRFISGMGAAAVLMTAVASVRDRYVGDAMARIMSLVLTIFLFTPIVAPALGVFVLKYYSWKAVFVIPPAFATIVLLWSFRIRESHPKAARSEVVLTDLLPKIKSVLTDLHYVRYVLISTLIFSVLSCYVSSSERIIGEIYHEPELFPVIFGGIGLLMAIFSLSNSWLTKKLGAKRTLRYILWAYLSVAVLLLLSAVFQGNPPPLIVFFSLVAILMALTTAGDPNSSALAMEFMGDKAGLAASVWGTFFFFIGSALGTLISSQMTEGVVPFAVSAVAVAALSLVLFFSNKQA